MSSTVMGFGKHAKKTVAEVMAANPSYIAYMIKNDIHLDKPKIWDELAAMGQVDPRPANTKKRGREAEGTIPSHFKQYKLGAGGSSSSSTSTGGGGRGRRGGPDGPRPRPYHPPHG